MKISNVNIYLNNKEDKLLAFASIVIDDCFAIHSLKILKSEKGLFVAMPSAKLKDTFKDICHPITSEAREMIEKAVIDKYNETINK